MNYSQRLWLVLAISAMASYVCAQVQQEQQDVPFLLANTNQSLSAHVTPRGVVFDAPGNTRDTQGKGTFTLSLVQWGSKGKLQDATSSRIYAENNVIRHVHSSALQKEGIVEEFTNTPDGIQQQFIVTARPQGTGSLQLRLHVDGAVVNTEDTSSQNSGATIIAGSGRHLVYDQLVVTDSKGQRIPGQLMVAKNNTMNVFVDDANAQYPLSIRPVLSEVGVVKATGSTPGKKLAGSATPAKPAELPELPAAIKDDIKRLGNTSSEGLHEVVNPDGSTVVDLQGRFQSVPVAVIDSQGKVHVYMHGEDYKPGVVTKTEDTKP